jgi:hypothetical protein
VGQTCFTKNKKEYQKAQKDMERVVNGPLNDETLEQQRELAKEIESLLEKEEIHWSQQSMLNWLQAGDKNTSYFHNFASERRRKNRINKLKDDSGNWVEGHPNLNPMISQYFAGLFTTEIDEPDPQVLEKVIPKVTDPMNEQLMRPYNADDVKKALFSIGDLKAPGGDGLHAVFSRNAGIFWALL